MDVYLIVMVSIMAILIFVVCVFLVVYYGHPDDAFVAKLPKLVVVFGLFLSFASVLVLPYDVANSRGDGGGLDVDILWYIIYCSFAIFLFVVIPFAFFFYESDVDPDVAHDCGDTQGCQAVKYTLVTALIFVILLVVLYATSNTAYIPVQRVAQQMILVKPYTVQVYNQDKANKASTTPTKQTCGTSCLSESVDWTISVTFPIYVMGLLSFVGWFFFMFFVGVGFFALPMDMINDYRTRPKRMTTIEYMTERQAIAERAAKLKEVATFMRDNLTKSGSFTRTEKRKAATNMNKFMKYYYYLKKDIEILETSYALKGGNPFIPWFNLIFGIAAIGISISWILHIILFMLPDPPFSDFLNTFFVQLEDAFGTGNFGLLGVIAFAIWSYYLLACAVKGNFKLGLRFFFWKIYPMELHKTYMNAFLVNTWIIMLCAVPAVQFCAWAFPIYARYTDINNLFGTQVKYLAGMRYLWMNNVFEYIMIIIAFLSLIVFLASPNDRAKKIEEELDLMRRGRDD